MESKIQLLQGQSQDTLEAAKKGYEAITLQVNKQSMEVAKVLTNASDSFDRMKQEMQAIKVTSSAELKRIFRTAAATMEAIDQVAIGEVRAPWSTRQLPILRLWATIGKDTGNGTINLSMQWHRSIESTGQSSDNR